jgi:hypothetical protein
VRHRLIGTGTKALYPGGRGQSPRRWTPPNTLFHHTAGAFSFSIEMQRDRTAPAPHIASSLPPSEAGAPFYKALQSLFGLD